MPITWGDAANCALAPAFAFGLVDVHVAAPYTEDAVFLGHANDSIQIRSQTHWHDVWGDRNGGPQGSPIERQYLGHVDHITMRLSTWNVSEIENLERRAGLVPTNNASPADDTYEITQADNMGAFALTNNSIRLVLVTNSVNTSRNYWCCLLNDAIEVGMGTKYAEYSLGFTAYRPPCGHEADDILYDRYIEAGFIAPA